LIAFAITAMTGVMAAAPVLGSISDLWATRYGLVLTMKSAGVLVMVVLSASAWRRGFGLIRFEAGVAILVLAATAVLAVTPVPTSTNEGLTVSDAANTRR
jgi:putative copper export protein